MDANNELDVSVDHPELHHYTTWEGLQGILQSQALWSVQYDRMNDPGEFVYSKRFLSQTLAKMLESDFEERAGRDPALRARFQNAGGFFKVVENEVRNWIDAHYNSMLHWGNRQGLKIPFCIPHITSFCTHVQDMDYERENGLLSQWRGYGIKGAFALVFETAALSELVMAEYKKFTYLAGSMFDVRYDRQPMEIKDNYTDLVTSIAKSYTDHMFGEGEASVNPNALQKMATRIKHRGFFEEREVRLVLYPMYQEFADAYKNHPGLVNSPTIKHRYADHAKPHLALFEDLGIKLPLKRIIVGPSATQKDDIEKVNTLVKQKIKVFASETPYRQV